MEPATFRRRPSRWAAAAAGLAGTAVVAACTVAAVSADSVSAAPNPYIRSAATHTITIDSDGSYRVHVDQTMELARDYDFAFGGTVHDGFRLPDTESVLPPYLRARYSEPAIAMDGQSAEVDVGHLIHSVDISAADAFTEGEHEGTVDYRVTGAAVGSAQAKTNAGGVVVYFRPLVPGDVIVKAEEAIIAVECEDWPPAGEACGQESGEDWLIGKDELQDAEAVRVILDINETDLSKPRIDVTK